MGIGFGDAVLIFGGLLTAVAALSGVMKGTVLSASVLSVALGVLLLSGLPLRWPVSIVGSSAGMPV